MAGVYSPYGDIEITGGEVRAENFNVYGLYARRGSVSIGGDAEVTVSSAARSSAIGISGGNMGSGSPDTQSGGNVYIRGGNTAIEVPYIGVFVQYVGDTESGKIEIMGGTFSVNVTEGTQNIGAALYAQGAEADVVVRGGTIGAVAGGSNGQATFGIYADRFLQVEGGSVRAGAENTDAAGLLVRRERGGGRLRYGRFAHGARRHVCDRRARAPLRAGRVCTGGFGRRRGKYRRLRRAEV